MDQAKEMPSRPLSMLESVAELHSQNQRYDQAIYFYSLALEKSDPIEKERLFMCIAQNHVNNKNYNEALVYFLKVLSSKSARLEFNSSEIIQVSDKILSFCDTLQTCQKCIDSLEKSLLLSHNYSKDHTYPKLISKLYETIASIYHIQKDFPSAIKYFEKAITSSTLENPDAVDLLENYQQLASIYLEQKSEINALSWLQKGLDMLLLKEPKEENYEKIEQLAHQIGSIYLNKKEFSLAIQNYRICLETKMKRFGLSHSELVSTLNVLADIYYQQGNYNDSLVCYNQSYRMIVKTGMQEQETQLIQVYWKIGLIYKHKKNWSEALKYFSKTLKAVKSAFQGSKDKLIPIYKEIGDAYYNMGKYEDSVKFLKKAIKTEKELLGDASSNNLEIYLKIVNLYELLGEYKKARDFLLQLFLLQKKLFGDYNLCTQATLGRLQTLDTKIKEIQ